MARSPLQSELKKKQPFESPTQEAALNIVRTGDQIENRFGRLFRAYGLTFSQFNVLRILRGEGRPLPSLEIADRMIRVTPAITGLIDRLEAVDMVARRRCDEDRRVVYVEITTKAVEVLNRLDEPLKDLHRELLGHLSQEELMELNRLLVKTRRCEGPE